MNVSDFPLPVDWTQMLHRYVALGWSPAFLTFMFAQMAGGPIAIRCRQASEVETIYGRVLTRVVRDPLRACNIGRHPVWLCAADFPIRKRARHTLREITINDGQHVHALALTPPRSRLKSDLATFVAQNQLMLTNGLRCSRVHAEAVLYDVPKAFGYGMKSAMRLPDDDDGFFLLPRSLSEICDAPGRVGRNSSLFGSSGGGER